MDLSTIVSIIFGFMGVFLLIITYTYIDKLEKIGCACAEHPYRNFIKKYCVFAIAYLAITMFFPPAVAARTLGLELGAAYMFVKMAFGIATVVFFVLALIYVRYLMREKCKCSEDVRREVLYLWAILEIVMIAAIIIIPTMIIISFGAFVLLRNTVLSGTNRLDEVIDAVYHPMDEIKKVPKNLKKIQKSLRLRK